MKKKLFIGISIININTTEEIKPIKMLLVTAANIIASVTSKDDKGAYKISIIFPCIFEIISELTEWEKLWSIIDWIISPGAKKIIKE